MTYAVYRCLYGEDFIQESIKSIDKFVDRIFVFWDDRTWGDVTECTYKGEVVKFPKKFDNILDKIKELNNPKINLIYDHQYNNVNQFTHFVNDIILTNYPKPDIILFIEVDHVFRQDQLELCLSEVDKSVMLCHSSNQVELWRTPFYRVPERRRFGTMFWKIPKEMKKIPSTGRHANIPGLVYLKSYVHNLGYCVSEETMYWKHMTALGFSQKIGDSKPNKHWFENTWINWDYVTNNKDLEVSLGYEHKIPEAVHYDVSELPKEIKEKYEIK